MTLRAIPVRNQPLAYRMSVELDGQIYSLRFQINRRDGYWRMDLERDRVVVLHNIKLVHTDDLLSQYRHIPNLPPGKLGLRDQAGQSADPDELNFGDQILLVYEEAV